MSEQVYHLAIVNRIHRPQMFLYLSNLQKDSVWTKNMDAKFAKPEHLFSEQFLVGMCEPKKNCPLSFLAKVLNILLLQ